MTSTIKAAVQFLGLVADSYREHAKTADNLQEIEGYEGSAAMADKHANDLRVLLANGLRVSEDTVERGCKAMAMAIAKQDGIVLTDAGYEQGKLSRPEEHKQMHEYVRACLEAAIGGASDKA